MGKKRQRGTVYPRGNILWLAYVDELGVRQAVSTGLPVGEEKKAQKILDGVLRRVDAVKAAGVSGQAGPLTFVRYLKRWSDARRERELSNADADERRLQIHAVPRLGAMKLDEIKVRDIKALMLELRKKIGRAKGDMAPRTARSVYFLLHTLFSDAIEDELLEHNPCALRNKSRYIPEKEDKDPTWRPRAVYSRKEVEQLISDPRIPEYRRTRYALVFLTGMRINEVAARLWRDYDEQAEPLGRLLVLTSYNRRKKIIKGTKTSVSRQVPVHPTLAKILAAWKLRGFRDYVGRPPREDDPIVPFVDGGIPHNAGSSNPNAKLTDDQVAEIRSRRQAGESTRTIGSRMGVSHKTISLIARGLSRTPRAPTQAQIQLFRDNIALRELHSDLAMLGLRLRTMHNGRRTNITLTLAGGASKVLLRPMTHGSKEDQIDDYHSVAWETLCQEVLKLKVEVLEGRVLALPIAVGQLQSPLQSRIEEVNQMVTHGREGTRTLHEGSTGKHGHAPSVHVPRESLTTRGDERHVAEIHCSDVAEALRWAHNELTRRGFICDGACPVCRALEGGDA